MNALTHAQVSEYPWGFQPEDGDGYEYAEFHSACEACHDGIQEGHALCYPETIPNPYEIASSPVLLPAGWYVLARRPALGSREEVI